MNFILKLIVAISEKSRAIRNWLIRILRKIRTVLASEGQNAIVIIEIYSDYTLGKASKKDIKKANKMFRDLLKTAGLGVFLILPLAPITIPFIVKLGARLGVDVIPNSIKAAMRKRD